MRVFQRYHFNVKTKIPFAQWPEIIHCFLEEQGLSSGRFLYHFSEFVHDQAVGAKACARLQKDCPGIGEARPAPTAVENLSEWVITNLDGAGDFREEQILPVMGKIQRSYGFASVLLCYSDVDFFGRVIPAELEGDPVRTATWRLHGSTITLNRDAVFGTASLDMSIDVLQDGQLLDASPYCAAMQKLLPDVRVESTLLVVLSEEEKRQAAAVDQAAQPMLERCRAFFRERMPQEWAQTLEATRYSLATALKKLAKQHGYAYSIVWAGGTFGLAKRTKRGNIVFITADAGPSRTRTDFCVDLQGPGFRHRLASAAYAPTTQTELEAMLGQAMEVVCEFERSLLPELDACFPECPAWFEPQDKR